MAFRAIPLPDAESGRICCSTTSLYSYREPVGTYVNRPVFQVKHINPDATVLVPGFFRLAVISRSDGCCVRN